MSDFFCAFSSNTHYIPPVDHHVLETIDMHTAGEPLRVITSGYPEIQASSLLAYRRILHKEHDYLRTALMFEPRGHADMYGCLLLPPFHPEADCSVIFMHNEGYSTMCGHAVIAIMTLAVKMGWVEVKDRRAQMTIEAPCGLIHAWAVGEGEEIQVYFDCVPSFVLAQSQQVYIESLQQHIRYDIAYGGAFYAYVDADALALDLLPRNYHALIRLGKEIKAAVQNSDCCIKHPFEDDLSFLYGVIFTGRSEQEGVDSRHVCVFADGELDRSPTGSGVSGRAALRYMREEIALQQPFVIDSLIGSRFIVSAKRQADFGSYKAIIPTVQGQAFIYGTQRFILDPKDKLVHGFLLR